MRTVYLFLILPLIAACALFYFIGREQGARAQKREDTQHNIWRAKRILRWAEAGDTTNIVKLTRMSLLGHTRTYDSLVPDSQVPTNFRSTLIEARQISAEVESNLIIFDPRKLK